MELEIKCAHEMGSNEKTVPDYHPLTRQELLKLLTIAAGADARLANKIHVRLTQAIRGMVCPTPYGTEVGERMAVMDSLYVETRRKDPRLLPGMVEQFYALLEPNTDTLTR